MRPIRHFRRMIVLTVLAVLVLIIAPWGWMFVTSIKDIKSPDQIASDDQRVAIVFGAKVNGDGTPGDFLTRRLDVAVELYEQGKAKVILVSGTTKDSSRDEPAAMRKYLVSKGVNDAHIVSDPKGVDTYSTCQRAKQVYGIDKAFIVTQGYHLPRALFACRDAGIDSLGVTHFGGIGGGVLLNWVRELPASWKMLLDVSLDRKLPDPVEKSNAIDVALTQP